MRTLIALLIVLLLPGCSGGEPKDASSTAPSGDNLGAIGGAPPQEERPTTRPAAAAAAEPVEVHLIEYAIHMPSSVPAGTQTFNVANGGKEMHNFEIEGNGIEKKLPDNLTGGGNAALTVDLKPGTYTVYCPVKDHRKKGMELTLTVK